jgi:hypothetical protein
MIPIVAFSIRSEQQIPGLLLSGAGHQPPSRFTVVAPDSDDNHNDDGSGNLPPDEPPDGEEDVFVGLDGETTAGYLERVTRDVARRFEDRDLADASYLCRVVREVMESNPAMRGGPWCPPMRSRELRAAEAFLDWLQRTAGMDRLLAEQSDN